MAKKEREKKIEHDIYCQGCNKTKKERNFYQSNSPKFDNDIYWKHTKMCKDCIKDMIYKKGTNQINKEAFIKSLRDDFDMPFFNEKYLQAINSGEEVLGKYLKLLNLTNKKEKLTFEDGETGDEDIDNNRMNNVAIDKQELQKLTDKWGTGYSNDEYLAFEKKYQQLKNNYNQLTAMHTEALLKYIRYSCKEEMATASNNVDEAKKWADMANKAATNAKINPSQLSKADLSDGLSTFSELSQAVEKEVDIIPILPKFKYRPNDALDFNIWCYVNYERDLAGLPPCKYEDVYAFYDKRKQDYIEQYGDPYGIFTNDTSEKNRDNIKKFIKEDEDAGSEE